MSTIQAYTTAARPSASASNIGLTIFNTTDKAINVSDGENWRAYSSDGLIFGSNSYAVSLNGSNQKIELGDISSTVGGQSNISVAFWMKLPATTSTVRLFSLTSTLNSGFDVQYNTSNELFAVVGTGSNYAGSTQDTAEVIDDNTWRHFCFVFDGTESTDSDRFKAYVNKTNKPMTRNLSAANPASLQSDTGDSPKIGVNRSGTNEYAEALFDDFAVFDTSLTASQIASIYDSQIYPTSLKHLYRFENNFNDSVGSVNASGTNTPSFPTGNLPY